MIEVTRLNDTKLLINSDQIEFVEETPDTVISFLSGKKIIVKESRQEIQNLVILYRRKILNDCLIFRGQAEQAWAYIRNVIQEKNLMVGEKNWI